MLHKKSRTILNYTFPLLTFPLCFSNWEIFQRITLTNYVKDLMLEALVTIAIPLTETFAIYLRPTSAIPMSVNQQMYLLQSFEFYYC